VFFVTTKPAIETEDEYKLLGQFISVSSISGNERDMGQLLVNWLENQKWTVEKQQVTETTFNVFAHRGNRNPK